MLRFYYHFAAMYGTIWFALVVMALIGQTRIDAGEFGLYGFPVIALLFAIVMTIIEQDKQSEKDSQASTARKLAELEEKIRQLKTEQMIKGPDQFNV